MKDMKRLTYRELSEISQKISEKTYFLFDKEVKKEIRKLLEKQPLLKCDIVAIYTSSIFDVMLNIFKDTNCFIEKEKLDISFKEIVKLYSEMLMDFFNKKRLIDLFNKEKTDTIN